MINFNKALINAAAAGDPEFLEMAIAGGANINALEEKDPLFPSSLPPAPIGVMALRRAIIAVRERALEERHLQIVRRLIEIGVDVNAKPYPDKESYPLHNAIHTGHEALIRLLLERGAVLWTTGQEGAGLVRWAGNRGLNWFITLFMQHLGVDEPGSMVVQGLETALCDAARNGHLETVRLLLTYGVSAEARENYPLRDTALMQAAAWGHQSIVKLLLEHGANSHAVADRGNTVLVAAAQGELTGLALKVMEEGADVNASDYYTRTSIHKAASAGNELLARELVQRGANLKARDHGNDSVLHDAAYGGNKWILEACLNAGVSVNAENDWGYTPLMQAAKAGHIEAMEFLVSRGAKVRQVSHYEGETALHFATYRGYVEAVRWLLENGADVEAPVEDSRFSGAPTPLGLAATQDHLVLAQLFLDFGARLVPDNHSENLTPLHHAAQADAAQVTTLLISHGAPVDARDDENNTPLHFVMGDKNTEVARLLLEAGADPNVQETTCGSTPLWSAASSGRLELSKVLLEFGADPSLRDTRTNQTPREAAASNGHLRIVQLLDNHSKI